MNYRRFLLIWINKILLLSAISAHNSHFPLNFLQNVRPWMCGSFVLIRRRFGQFSYLNIKPGKRASENVSPNFTNSQFLQRHISLFLSLGVALCYATTEKFLTFCLLFVILTTVYPLFIRFQIISSQLYCVIKYRFT